MSVYDERLERPPFDCPDHRVIEYGLALSDDDLLYLPVQANDEVDNHFATQAKLPGGRRIFRIQVEDRGLANRMAS